MKTKVSGLSIILVFCLLILLLSACRNNSQIVDNFSSENSKSDISSNLDNDSSTANTESSETPSSNNDTSKTTTSAKETNSSQTTSQKNTSTKENTPSSNDDTDLKLTGFSNSDIAELKGVYVDSNNENGPCYSFTIKSISNTSAQIDICYVGYNLSPIYEATGITIPLKWGNQDKTILTGNFNWNDSWGNSGTGVIKIEKMMFSEPDVILNMKVTQESPEGWNRATLATNGDKSFFRDF